MEHEDQKKYEDLYSEISNFDEGKNIEFLLDLLTRYKAKLDSSIRCIEDGKFIFAYQKLSGVSKGLEYLKARVIMRMDSLKENDNNKNS